MAEIVSARPSPTTRLATAGLELEIARMPDLAGGERGSQAFCCPDLWSKTIELRCERPEALLIHSLPLFEAAFAEIAAPPITVTQDGSTREDPHRFHLVLLVEGCGTYRWAGGSVTQMPGDIVLIDTMEPSQVVSPVSARLLRWSFPEALIAPFLPVDRRAAVLHLPAREGLMTVLARHAWELAREAHRLDRGVQHGLLAHLCGLLGLAIEAERSPAPVQRCNLRTYQRQRILSYIETHLADSRLTARRAAKDLGMSPRWLHALLEEVGSGFPDLVASRRLKRCRALLEDPASDHLSITEIAFLWGFNDLSTFYRRFGERYGMTPGEARRRRPHARRERPPARQSA